MQNMTAKKARRKANRTIVVKCKPPYWNETLIVKGKHTLPIHTCPKSKCNPDCIFEIARKIGLKL